MADSKATPGTGRTRRLVLGVIPIVAIFVVWAVGAAVLDNGRIYPSPLRVAQEIGSILSGEGGVGNTYAHLIATLVRLIVAFVISFVVGSALGILAGTSPAIFELLTTIMWPILAVPSVVWAFIFLIVFGISNAVPILAVAMLMFPLVLIHVAEGTKSIPKELREMSDSYGVHGRQRLFDLYLPYLVPFFAGSARISFAIAMKIIIVVEVVGLSSGIGYEISYWYGRVNMTPILAWGILLILAGLAFDYGVFVPLVRRSSRWRGSSKGDVLEADHAVVG